MEKSLATLDRDDTPCSRGVVYGRYIITTGSSLYLPPFEYVDVFGNGQNRCLPMPRVEVPGTNLFNTQAALGVHYHKNYLTPYWDPEGGYAVDVTYKAGVQIFGADDFQQVYGQVSWSKPFPTGSASYAIRPG